MKLRSLIVPTLLIGGMLGAVAQEATDVQSTKAGVVNAGKGKKKFQKKRRPRPFYSAKSMIIGVAGDYEMLENAGLQEKIFENPVEIKTTISEPADIKNGYTDEEEALVVDQLNNEGVGLKILQYLYTDPKTGEFPHFNRLGERSFRNTQKADRELFGQSFMGVDNLSREDEIPLLENNYIVLTNPTPTGTYYMVFKVAMDKETAFDMNKVFEAYGYQGEKNSAKAQEVFNSLNVPILFVTSGKFTGTGATEESSAELRKELAKNAPAFAVRGQIIGRHPMRANFGLNEGAKVGDKVEIYRQMQDKKTGEYVSKRISTAKIGAADSTMVYLFPVAGNKGSRANGDLAVVVPDKNQSLFFDAVWSPHVWGFDVTYTYQAFVTKYGITGQALGNLGIAFTDHPGETFETTSREQFKSPIFGHIGLGFGVSYTVAGLVEFMPYALVQAEVGYMLNKETLSLSSSEKVKDITGVSVRVPVGLRVNFNLGYKFQISIGGGWAYNHGIKDDKDFYKSYHPVQQACDILGAKRQGVFINAGLRWRF